MIVDHMTLQLFPSRILSGAFLHQASAVDSVCVLYQPSSLHFEPPYQKLHWRRLTEFCTSSDPFHCTYLQTSSSSEFTAVSHTTIIPFALAFLCCGTPRLWSPTHSSSTRPALLNAALLADRAQGYNYG